jgi:predicted MFS family arabinose efflux permease
MGIGCLIWTPLSLWLGRRPVLVFCAGLMAITTFASGAAGSFRVYVVTIAIQGLANGVAVSTVCTTRYGATCVCESH